MNKYIALLALVLSTGLQAKETITDDYIDETFFKVSNEVGVPMKLLRAVCWSESRLNPEAYNYGDGKDNNHAFGICQILHNTAKDFGFKDSNCYKDFSDKKLTRTYKDCKLFGVATNIRYAALYLKSKLERYDDNWINSIAAYNAGSVKMCKSGFVRRAKDNSIITTCSHGEIFNKYYIDKVLKALANNV